MLFGWFSGAGLDRGQHCRRSWTTSYWGEPRRLHHNHPVFNHRQPSQHLVAGQPVHRGTTTTSDNNHNRWICWCCDNNRHDAHHNRNLYHGDNQHNRKTDNNHCSGHNQCRHNHTNQHILHLGEGRVMLKMTDVWLEYCVIYCIVWNSEQKLLSVGLWNGKSAGCHIFIQILSTSYFNWEKQVGINIMRRRHLAEPGGKWLYFLFDWLRFTHLWL